MDKKKVIIIETSVISDLHLEDAEGSSTRVESYEDVGFGDQEDASKQGRMIVDLDADEGVALVDETQWRNNQDIFDTSIFDDEEVVAEEVVTKEVAAEKKVSTADPVPTAGEVVTTAGVEVSAATITSQISMDEITLAKALIDIKKTKPKAKGIVIQEPKKSRLFMELIDKRKKYFARLRAEKIRSMPPTKAQKRNQMCTYLKNMENFKHNQLKRKSLEELQMLFNNTMKWTEAFVPMDTKLVKGNEKAEEGSSKRAANDDVTIEATPLSSKSPTIVGYKIYKEGRKIFIKIIKAYARFKKTKPVDDMDNLLFQTLKTMFEHYVEKNIWKYQQWTTKVLNSKLLDSCGVYCVTIQNMVYYLLVEKMYTFTRNILPQMWNDVRLQVDYEVEMAYALFRLIKRQIYKGYVPE
nr:hypothetical protein [Tanacetum cinerariifolium]